MSNLKRQIVKFVILIACTGATALGQRATFVENNLSTNTVDSDSIEQKAWDEFRYEIYSSDDGREINQDADLVPDIAPNSAWIVDEARALIEHAYYDSAEVMLKKYINFDSTDYEAWYLLGRIMNQKENLPLAMAYYYKSIAIDPYYSGPYTELAYLFDIFAQYDSMNYYLKLAISNDDEPEKLYYDFGYSFDLLNIYDSALVYYHNALAFDPKDDMAYLNIGAIMGNFGQMDSAYFYTNRSFEINPDAPEVSYNLGQILFAQGRAPEAIDYFQRVLALNPTKVEVKLYLGEIYESLGDSAMARIYFQEFVDKAPMIYRDDISRIKAKLGIE